MPAATAPTAWPPNWRCPPGGPPPPKPAPPSGDEELLAALYALRKELARKEKLPAFVIFTDAVLREICLRRPRNTRDLLAISGIGEVKAARYGQAFLDLVRRYPEEKG